MADENTKVEKEVEVKAKKMKKEIEKQPKSEETKKVETKVEEKVGTEKESKSEEKKVETKKVEKKEVPKKEVAIANGFSLKISPKQSVYVCKIIRGKSPQNAVERLQAVIDERRPVPMAGLEVGHKRGKGLAGGKFPKNACKAIMEIVKQADANAVVNGIENPVIIIAKSDQASAPFRKAGRKAKRTHIHIEVRDRTKFKRKIRK